MSVKELTDKFYEEFKFNEWPKTYKVDHETFANVCQAVFSNKLSNDDYSRVDNLLFTNIALGPNSGILFKGVELILKQEKPNESSNKSE